MVRRPRKVKKPDRSADLFSAGGNTEAVPANRVRWQATYRIIPSRYPPISVFERVAPREDWDALYALESLTNPRLREEAGNISMVPSSRRVNGPNASIVMAPFTHVSKERRTRFSDGTFGIYYAGHAFETALREVAFHMANFHSATKDPPTKIDFRTYKGAIDKVLHDIRGPGFEALLSPDMAEYTKPQRLARALRESGSNGIVYPSVRHPGGECIAAFWPDVVTLPVQANHIEMTWDGTRISDWFDFGTGARTKL